MGSCVGEITHFIKPSGTLPEHFLKPFYWWSFTRDNAAGSSAWRTRPFCIRPQAFCGFGVPNLLNIPPFPNHSVLVQILVSLLVLLPAPCSPSPEIPLPPCMGSARPSRPTISLVHLLFAGTSSAQLGCLASWLLLHTLDCRFVFHLEVSFPHEPP